jgi:hypothetical protein
MRSRRSSSAQIAAPFPLEGDISVRADERSGFAHLSTKSFAADLRDLRHASSSHVRCELTRSAHMVVGSLRSSLPGSRGADSDLCLARRRGVAGSPWSRSIRRKAREPLRCRSSVQSNLRALPWPASCCDRRRRRIGTRSRNHVARRHRLPAAGSLISAWGPT